MPLLIDLLHESNRHLLAESKRGDETLSEIRRFAKQMVIPSIVQGADGIRDRELDILSLRFGLDGSKPLTLEDIGSRSGVTRERIRQIERKAKTRLAYDPRRLIESFQTTVFQTRILRAKFSEISSKAGEDVHSLNEFVESVSQETKVWPFGLRLWINPEMADIKSVCRHFLEKEEVIWIDGERETFVRTSSNNPYVNTAGKFLQVFESIDLDSVRDGIAQTFSYRPSRPEFDLETEEIASILTAFGFEVEDDFVYPGTFDLDRSSGTELSPTEETLLAALDQKDDLTDLGKLRELVPELKRHGSTESQTLMGKSPLFERTGPSIYALRGAKHPQQKYAALLEKARTSGHPWIDRAGWDSDGGQEGDRLAYRLRTRGQLPSDIAVPEFVAMLIAPEWITGEFPVEINPDEYGEGVYAWLYKKGQSMRMKGMLNIWRELKAQHGDTVEFECPEPGQLTAKLAVPQRNLERITIQLGKGWVTSSM
jgi:hypothetical protein